MTEVFEEGGPGRTTVRVATILVEVTVAAALTVLVFTKREQAAETIPAPKCPRSLGDLRASGPDVGAERATRSCGAEVRRTRSPGAVVSQYVELEVTKLVVVIVSVRSVEIVVVVVVVVVAGVVSDVVLTTDVVSVGVTVVVEYEVVSTTTSGGVAGTTDVVVWTLTIVLTELRTSGLR